eukprot:2710729-Pyramimonas_sp.AAC.1
MSFENGARGARRATRVHHVQRALDGWLARGQLVGFAAGPVRSGDVGMVRYMAFPPDFHEWPLPPQRPIPMMQEAVMSFPTTTATSQG